MDNESVSLSPTLCDTNNTWIVLRNYVYHCDENEQNIAKYALWKGLQYFNLIIVQNSYVIQKS